MPGLHRPLKFPALVRMMRRLSSFALLILFMAACSRPLRGLESLAAASTSSTDEQIVSGGIARKFRLHVPPGYQPGHPLPLVLNFHGLTSNSKQAENLTGMSVKADQAGFIVVYPDAINAAWHDGTGADDQRDEQFVRDILLNLESRYSIDAKRIYASGISNGGGMTNRLGCDLADVIAAIAPDSGAYNFWQDCSPSRPVPVLAFHGLDDKLVPYDGEEPLFLTPPIRDWAAAWAARNGCSGGPAETSPLTGVSVDTWSACPGNAEVVLYTLANHGHSWPGSAVMPAAITSQAVNATDLIWDFFAAHPMP
jgi:polyhydroxybutyrate depolymerase